MAIKEGEHCNENLPPNIFIIAEATLVVEEQEEDHQGNKDHEANTLGLYWDKEADRGGDMDNSASVAISAIDMTEWNCVVVGGGIALAVSAEQHFHWWG